MLRHKVHVFMIRKSLLQTESLAFFFCVEVFDFCCRYCFELNIQIHISKFCVTNWPNECYWCHSFKPWCLITWIWYIFGPCSYYFVPNVYGNYSLLYPLCLLLFCLLGLLCWSSILPVFCYSLTDLVNVLYSCHCLV